MLINRTSILQQIKILTADGKTDSINIQPGGRVHLPEGAEVHPNKVASYRQVLKTVADPVAPVATTTVAATVDTTATATAAAAATVTTTTS